MNRRTFGFGLVSTFLRFPQATRKDKSFTIAEVAAQFKRIVVERLGVDESTVVDKARLVEDLCADSLDIVKLVLATAEAFEVEITDTEWEAATTVGSAR